ncbi:MAG: hypothetical protein ACRCTQ_04730 [Brevinemataceae bacterium]
MIKILLWCFLLFVQTQTFTVDNSLSVKIYFLKQNYTPSEPIQIYFTIVNESNQNIEFTLSDVIYQSFMFELRTSRNELIALNPVIQSETETVFGNPSLYRTINLAPGESLFRKFNLRELYTINEQQGYYVKALFYPYPDNRTNVLVSDLVMFFQTPDLMVQNKINSNNIQQTHMVAVRNTSLPNEVVANLFESQMKKDWSAFLLNIDESQLIYSFNNYANQFDQAKTSSAKTEVLKTFQRFLTEHWNNSIISYTILDTVIKGDKAVVNAEATENFKFFHRKFRYQFSLYRNGKGIWYISDYTILVL